MTWCTLQYSWQSAYWAVSIPVFAGFSGGIGVLLGNTGGYIIGFLFSALVMWLIEKLFGVTDEICSTCQWRDICHK